MWYRQVTKEQKQAKWTHHNGITVIFISIFVLLNYCTTTQSSLHSQPPPTAQAKTILPNFSEVQETLVPEQIILPAAMVLMAYVTRTTAEVRVGPGTQFRLKDALLTRDTPVIMLERVGAWQKVIDITRTEIGWVHHVTLGKMKLNTKPVTIKSDLLPRVFAIRRLTEATPYQRESGKTVETSIPKGKSFIALRYKNKKVLVYLPATNSVVWLDGGIVQ